VNESQEPDGVRPVQEEDMPGSETLVDIGMHMTSLVRKHETKQRRRRQARLFGKKALKGGLAIAFVCVLAVILLYLFMLCWPAIEAGLHFLFPQN
jgi:hypothetical protein